jgi:uncharacterized protein YcbK (DUF882 family)
MSRFTEKDLIKSETATRRGIDNSIAPEHRKNLSLILALLDEIESILGCQISVTSCYRSPKLNTAVGGSKTSSHSILLAVDFEVKGMSNLKVCETLSNKLKDYDQIINEFPETDGWVHVGISIGAGRKQKLTANKINGKTVYSQGFK